MAEAALSTARLHLRRIAGGDAEWQFRHLNDQRVMAHLGGPKSLGEIEARHAKMRALFESEGFGFLMMIERSSGELVGTCGIKRVDCEHARNLGDHEIGWLVREDRWRRGYAAEAMRAVLGWAFATHRAPHVVALTSHANEPSWRLMERLGMERREELDFEDPAYPPHENPTILYRLTRHQWSQTQ